MGSSLENNTILKAAHDVLVKNFEEFLNIGNEEIYEMPADIFKQILESDHLILRTRRGNITPGVFREYHILEQALLYSMKNQTKSFQYFLDAVRISDIFEEVCQPRFQSYECICLKSEIVEVALTRKLLK